jgi:hypothetical protein
MGRYGSGKATTDYRHKIDVRFMRRYGYLRPGAFFTLRWSRNGVQTGSIQGRTTWNSIVLSYLHQPFGSDQWQRKEQAVELVRTPCNYGGQRTWFLCPVGGCGRRVGVLYSGSIFACRHCHQLVYQSQREQSHDRALRRAQAIRMKLGGSANMLEPFPDIPKGMHWRTYERLRSEHDRADAVHIGGLARLLGWR